MLMPKCCEVFHNECLSDGKRENSWLCWFLQESRIYAVAKSGMRVSEASPGARGPGRGESPPGSDPLILLLQWSNSYIHHSAGRNARKSCSSCVCVCMCHELGWCCLWCRRWVSLWSDMSFSWFLSCCGGWVWLVWICHCCLWCHFL